METLNKSRNHEMIWGHLIHLGYNMWRENDSQYFEYGDFASAYSASSLLRLDKDIWDEMIEMMPQSGINTLLIDLGEGIKYESHPELAVKGSWTVDKFKKELDKIRSLGITPIPKLNFSTGHDEWMGEYSRCVSTPKYYEVCKDLINEVCDLFDNPKLFHLGMDEETYKHQAFYNFAIVRNGDLWWNDLYFYIDLLEKRGVRPWVWSDYIWHNEDLFLRKMPKSVLQSNWYYDNHFDNEEDSYVKGYLTLEKNGYDQIPTGSNWLKSDNFDTTVKFSKGKIAPERLLGFLQTTWKPTTRDFKYRQLEAIDLVAQAKRKYFL